MLSRFGLAVSLCYLIQPVFSQNFLFPLNPNKPCHLAGNMGEIRQNHFHTGLDIVAPTGAKVLAAADGYISKIRVSTYGYGKVVYLTHPSTKHQTVYAHLDGFAPDIARIVRQKQYQQETFEIELDFKPNQLPVKKGEWIARCGNTGSSAGSHLHFEVRTLDGIALNPALFGFKELPPDNVPPLIQKIALTPLEIDSRIQNLFARQEYTPVKIAAGNYKITEPILAFGKIGLEVLTHDIMNKAGNTYGIRRLELWVNQQKKYAFNLDRIALDHNHCMNVHINYEAMKRTGNGFQKCYWAEGNTLKGVYDLKNGKGYLKIQAGKRYEVVVHLYDTAGNKTTLQCTLSGKTPPEAVFQVDMSPVKPTITHQVSDNYLLIKAKNLKKDGTSALLSFNGLQHWLPIAAMQGKEAVYLWDLRDGLPDLVEVGAVRHTFNFSKMIPPEKNFAYRDEFFKIDFPANTLFDTLYLETEWKNQQITLGNPFIPLAEKPQIQVLQTLPIFQQKARQSAFYALNQSCQETTWQGKTATFSPQYWGSFRLQTDTTPPQIKLLRKSAKEILLRIDDSLSGIDSFKATLNGKFILLNYESKIGVLQTELLDTNSQITGKFSLIVQDSAGNSQYLNLSMP